jgi:hypothetical protein
MLLAGYSRRFFDENLAADAAAGPAMPLSMGTAGAREHCAHVSSEYSGCCAKDWENRKNCKTLLVWTRVGRTEKCRKFRQFFLYVAHSITH